MDNPLQTGDWLLIDAAGPALVVGVIRDGKWLSRGTDQGEALERIEPMTRKLLQEANLRLPDLSGCIYARGPGSTLGLRLAAMFLKGLITIPAQSHWRCLGYNNLELACASMGDASGEAGAPWRRDRFHLTCRKEGAYKTGGIDPEYVFQNSLPVFKLGTREPRKPEKMTLLPYPVDRIPEIIQDNPMLLSKDRDPVPYSAETPDFVKWSPRRHGGS